MKKIDPAKYDILRRLPEPPLDVQVALLIDRASQEEATVKIGRRTYPPTIAAYMNGPLAKMDHPQAAAVLKHAEAATQTDDPARRHAAYHLRNGAALRAEATNPTLLAKKAGAPAL